MKALVLSAGYGERLLPLTSTIPKPLLEVGGRPLIRYPLLMLKHAGIKDAAINVHHLAGEIQHALGDGAALGISITYSPETILQGTGGPLLALRSYFGSEAFLILNCDTIIDLDLNDLIAFHRRRAALATFLLRRGDIEAYSRIEIDRDGRIRRMRLLKARSRGEFVDYPAALPDEVAATLAPYMYCGVMVCEPAIFDMVPTTPPFSLMADLFAPVAARGLPLAGFVHDGFFRTVDDRPGYEALRAEFAASPPSLAYLPR